MAAVRKAIDCFINRLKSPISPPHSVSKDSTSEKVELGGRQKNFNNVFEVKNRGIESPLFKAARQNDVETLKNLIEEKHIDPYERGSLGK